MVSKRDFWTRATARCFRMRFESLERTSLSEWVRAEGSVFMMGLAEQRLR